MKSNSIASSKGVKENDGKAAKHKIWYQFLAIFLVAATIVVGVIVFGTAPWHSQASPREEQGQFKSLMNDESSKRTNRFEGGLQPDTKSGESNFIQFEFSNLDGEIGNSGIVVVELHPEWAPLGVKRIKELTRAFFWEGRHLMQPCKNNEWAIRCRAFRVVPNFVVQLGINGNPAVQKEWKSRHIEDDPVKTSNERGTVSFAMAGKGTRTTQIFFNVGQKNGYLDKEGFAPFGKVISGLDVLDRIYQGYREKPNQGTVIFFLSKEI